MRKVISLSLQKPIGRCPLGPFARRIFGVEFFVGLLQRLGVVRALVLAYSSIVDCLWSRVALGIILQQGVQARDGFRECFPLKMGLSNSQ